MYAAIVGNLPALDLLVAAGADIDVHESKKGATPLIIAIDFKRVSIVNRLIDIGADVDARMMCGKTALIGASRLGLDVVIQHLIDNGADVHAVTNSTMIGATGLIYAAGAGHGTTVKLLIEAGADVNARCADGSTALFWACHRGHVSVVSVLLDNGADKHLTGLMGLTPSRIPMVSNRAAIIALLRLQ
jgi:ankyrin repeat protein